MPEGPQFGIEGSPLLDTQLRGITEALAGAGVVNPGDLEISVGTGDMEIDAAGGTAILDGTEYSFGGASPAATLSTGNADHDRWDTVAFDTGTTSVVVHEGTPDATPTAPDIQAGEVPLAVVSVSQGQTALGSSDIHNIRGAARTIGDASEVPYDDSPGVYGINNVDAALDELQEAAQVGSYPLPNSDLSNSTVATTVDSDTGLGLTSSVGLGGTLTLSRSRGQSYYAPEVSASESGTVTSGNQGVVLTHGLADGETLEVYKASLLVTAGGGVDPPPIDLHLIIATVTSSGYSAKAPIISGDGSTITDDETGNPLESYTNSSGSGQTVAVLVNNQTTSDQDIDASAYGQIA